MCIRDRHKLQPEWWRLGYDVWGKVVAKQLVAKSKWQADRAMDFYDDVLYNKKTLGSLYAKAVIYSGSWIIGYWKLWRKK